ncbi:MAG: GxxExxY protein [Spirochaetaceae bacterium]|nr:GxxExxY protein [Spirochaetaceae bacterium]
MQIPYENNILRQTEGSSSALNLTHKSRPDYNNQEVGTTKAQRAHKGTAIDCPYRIDMMVEHGRLLIENKAAKELNDVHLAQMLTYLKLSGISLGFLLELFKNFSF